MPEGVGGFPRREGLEERFDLFLRENQGVAGIDFLRGAVSYVRDQAGYSAGDFLCEMCEGILASNYPVPDRMLKLSKLIVGQDQRRKPSVHGRHRQGTSRPDWRI
jgi:aspartate 4-decarboxylase